MSTTDNESLLETILNSWDRNNSILVNLLHAVPDGAMDARVMETSLSVVEMFNHVHYVRVVFVSEDAPEFATEVPKQEWNGERDRDRLAQTLNDSARVVRDAVKGRLNARKEMDLHYDHPILLLQHMIWHEGYHHGQIKLALKATGHSLADREIGQGTWQVWMRKKQATS